MLQPLSGAVVDDTESQKAGMRDNVADSLATLPAFTLHNKVCVLML